MTPHQLVKGTRHSVPLELHPEHSTKPKGPKLWETSIFCLPSRAVKSMTPGQLAQALGFERPLGLCSGFRLEDPTYSVPMFLLFFPFSFFFFNWCSKAIFFYLGCPITLVFRDSQGLLNLSSRARRLGIP